MSMKHHEGPTHSLIWIKLYTMPYQISFLFACLFALFTYFYWTQISAVSCIPLISTNHYMPGKIRFSFPMVGDILEYLQVKMLTWDSLSTPKELQILFVINCHISQTIKPATHHSSRISKVDIILLCMGNLQLPISCILAANNSTAQLHTRLNLHPFQWAYIMRLHIFFPWSPSLKNDSGHQSAAAAAQGQASSLCEGWTPAHSRAATSPGCSHRLMPASCFDQEKQDFRPRSCHLPWHLSPERSTGGAQGYSVVLAVSLLCHPGMAPSLPVAPRCCMAPASLCLSSAGVSETKPLHSCPSSCLLEMHKTVNAPCSITGNILISCHRAGGRGWCYSVCRLINTTVTQV